MSCFVPGLLTLFSKVLLILLHVTKVLLILINITNLTNITKVLLIPPPMLSLYIFM